MAALSLYRLCNNMIFKTTPAFSPKLIGFLCSTFTSSSETRTDLNKEYDMVIVGGGIVGPALACSIGCEPSLSHKRVLLLQSSPLESPGSVAEEKGENSFSNRVSIFTQSSVNLLKKIGVWQSIEDVHVKPFTQMHVWDACSDARVVFDSYDIQSEGGEQETTKSDKQDLSEDMVGSHHDRIDWSESDKRAIGYVIENRVVQRALIEALERFSNIQVGRGTRAKVVNKVEKSSSEDALVEVMLNTGKNISTHLLVGSDGPNSRVRQLCGFSQVGWGHNQSALVATLNVYEAGSNSTLWQRLLPIGPIALLPLSDTHSSLIWCTSPSHTQSLLEMSPERFVDAVNSAFCDAPPQDDSVASILEDVKETLSFLTSTPTPTRQLPPSVTDVEPSSRAAFSLATGHTPYYVKHRIALVGDATHRVHPIAGQGINLGLGDVASLTHNLVQANSRGEDWGSLSHLLAYETSRQQQKVPTMAAIEGLNRLFSTSFPPLVFARSLALMMANAFPQVKEFIMEQAK